MSTIIEYNVLMKCYLAIATITRTITYNVLIHSYSLYENNFPDSRGNLRLSVVNRASTLFSFMVVTEGNGRITRK